MAKKTKKTEVTEIDETIQASKSFFEKNKKAILYGGGTILAIIIACLLIHQFYIVPRNQKANEALFKAEQIFQAGTFDKALNGDGESGGFLSVIDQFGSTKAGNLARLYAGICYYKDGKFQEAVDMLQSFDDCGDEMVSPSVIGMLGNIYAELGDNDKATATLLMAAKEADNNTLSPIYLLQAGQIFESLQQNDKALDCYKQIKEKYKQSQAYSEVDKYIERLSK
ncbi:MAG: tetratricopeptide repeat protein [Bacteroidaceae bacterium]|nr:tetratricopeptide repeat protein [Bacteroidaceae bacterium]